MNLQKHPSVFIFFKKKILKLKTIGTQMFMQKSCSENFRKVYRKTSTVQRSFSKVAGLDMYRVCFSLTTASDFPFQPLTP